MQSGTTFCELLCTFVYLSVLFAIVPSPSVLCGSRAKFFALSARGRSEAGTEIWVGVPAREDDGFGGRRRRVGRAPRRSRYVELYACRRAAQGRMGRSAAQGSRSQYLLADSSAFGPAGFGVV